MAELRYFIDLTSLKLEEAGLTWLHAFPVGTYQHPVYGELEFSQARLQRFAANVNNRVRGIDLAIDYAHREDASKGEKAAGWIKQADVRDNGLWIGVELTDQARQEIQSGEWRYLSPEFVDEWEHEGTGEKYEDVMLGAGLTNRPFLKDLLPIAASEDYIERLRPHHNTEVTQLDEKQILEAYTLLLLTDRRLKNVKLQDDQPNYYDLMFAQEMLGHHHRAIEMAAGELRSGRLPAVKDMARRIIDSQQAEVGKLLTWIKNWEMNSRGEGEYGAA